MSPKRRMAVFGGVGCAVIALAFLAVALGRDDSGSSAEVAADASPTTSSTTSTTSLEPTTTTVDLVFETTTTTAPRPTTTTSTTAPPKPVVTGAGAVLQPASSGASRKMQGEDCESLAESSSTADCGFATVKGGGTVVWLVESLVAPTGARRVRVFTAGSGAGSWRVALEARDDNGSRWESGESGVTVRVVDLSGDGGDEVVVGFRAASGGTLAMDVVEGPAGAPVVTAHRDLATGRSRVSPGQWDTWAAVPGSPGQFQHDVVRWQDGAWRVVLRSAVAASEVPPSQF